MGFLDSVTVLIVGGGLSTFSRKMINFYEDIYMNVSEISIWKLTTSSIIFEEKLDEYLMDGFLTTA